MAKLYLVRHGQDAGHTEDDNDPGLSDMGRQQAAEMSAVLAPLGPLSMIVSPLRRTRETAQPLEAAWNMTGDVVPAIREIPSPSEELNQRRQWLRRTMAGTWSQVAQTEAWLLPWRQALLDVLLGVREDTVVVSHFVAINVAAGAAQNDDRLTLFRPNNCSITVMETDGTSLSLLELGEALETRVG
jgi:broad specificity phosphatase PhoE